MNIGKASKLSDLTVKATRYYANIDLVKPKQDSQTGYRNYTEKDVLKLKFIGKARSFNFSIDECRDLLSLYENENRPSKEVKKITLEKISEIDKKLNDLTVSEFNAKFGKLNGMFNFLVFGTFSALSFCIIFNSSNGAKSPLIMSERP